MFFFLSLFGFFLLSLIFLVSFFFSSCLFDLFLLAFHWWLFLFFPEVGGCYIIILPRSSTIFLCVRIRPFDSLINEVFVSTATLNLWSSRLLLVLNSFHAYLNLPPAPSFRLFFISLCLSLSLRLAFGAGRAWCQWTIRDSHRYVLTWWAVRWRHPFFFIRFVLLGIPNNIPHAAGQAVLDDDDGQSEFIVTKKKKGR